MEHTVKKNKLLNHRDHIVIKDRMSSETGFKIVHRDDFAKMRFKTVEDISFRGTKRECESWIKSPSLREAMDKISDQNFVNKVPLPSETGIKQEVGTQASIKFS